MSNLLNATDASSAPHRCAQSDRRAAAANMLPLVSIITPVYNGADFLAETLDSVLSQDYPNLELIVLDDGSTDGSPQVIDRYRDRIIAVRHPNMGENRTVNRGLEMARGDILCVVNADDPLLPGAVTEAINYLNDHSEVVAAYPDWVEIDPDGQPLKTLHLPQYDIERMLLDFNVAMGPGVFFRRRALELIGMRNASLRYTGDLEYWFRLALRGKLGHIPKVLATHRTHPAAASSAAQGARMAGEIVQLVHTSFNSGYLPSQLIGRRYRILADAHVVACSFCGGSRRARLHHRLMSCRYRWTARFRPNSDGKKSVDMRSILSSIKRAIVFAGRLPIKIARSLRQNAKRAVKWSAQRVARWGVRLAVASLGLVWWIRNIFHPIEQHTAERLFALVSHVLPPTWSGQAMVIERIMRELNAHERLLIDSRGYSSEVPANDDRVNLPAEPGQNLWLRGGVLGATSVAFRIALRAWRIARYVRDAKCRTIVACSGDLIDLPASALASRMTGAPLVVYLFDDYRNHWKFIPQVHRLARRLEWRVVRRAAAVIVPNESLAESIRERHGIECAVVRNPAILPLSPHGAFAHREKATAPVIVYTGAVYHVNYSAFRTLIAAMEQLAPAPRLEIYTAQDPAQLANEGICGPNVTIHPHVAPEDAAHIQRRADVLFMGFSFDEQVAEVVQTSAPGKLGDYLSSGRPILALAPRGSFVATYFQKYRCGIIIDRDDSSAVAAALQRLLKKCTLTDDYIANASRIAREEFSPHAAAERFAAVLNKAA